MIALLPILKNAMAHAHPALVHFPIALLLTGAGLEAFGAARGRAGRSATARVLLGFGAPAALLAIASGLLLFHPGDFQGRTLQVVRLHRAFGLSTAAVAIAALLAGGIQPDPGPAGRRLRVYRLLYFTAAVMVGLTGHYGGWVVFGWGAVWPS